MKKLRVFIFVVIAVAGFISAGPVFAVPWVYIDPSLVDLNAAGDTVEVDINIANAEDVGAFQFYISYDPAVVTIESETHVTLGEFLPSSGLQVDFQEPQIDNVNGLVFCKAVIFQASSGPDGAGTLASVRFTIQSKDDSFLDLYDVWLVDVENNFYWYRVDPVGDADLRYTHITATYGPNGAISPAGLIPVPYGTDREFSILPATDYLVDDVLIDDISKGPMNSYTFENVTQNHTIHATFKIKEHNVTADAGDGGIVNGDLDQMVPHGTNATPFTAVPATGYSFTGWTGHHVGTENPLTLINVMSDMHVTATFQINTYTLNYSAGANGGLNGQLIQHVVHGNDAQEVEAIPHTGYRFSGWTGDYVGTENPLTVENVTGNMNINANFMMPNEFSVTFKTSSGGTLNGPTNPVVARNGSSVPVTAVPAEGHTFTGWRGDYVGTQNPLTVSGVTRDMTITAEFTPVTYTVNFSAGTNGRLTGTLTQTVNHGSATSRVTAVPDEGYRFAGWSGDIGGTANPLTVQNVTEDMRITADFTLINEYRVRFYVQGSGRLLGNTNQTVREGEDCSPVTAEANNDYRFTGWSGDASGTANPLTVRNVNSDKTVIAVFDVIRHTVTFQAPTFGSLVGDAVQEVVHGGSCTPVQAVGNSGYRFWGWTGDYEGSVNPLALPNITRDLTVTANFVQDGKYVVQFFAGENGRLQGETLQFVDEGADTAAVLALGNSGYYATSWSGDYTGNENPLVLENVIEDMRVTAQFSHIPEGAHQVIFTADAHGRLEGNTRQVVMDGESTTPVRALWNSGYYFTGWIGDYVGSDNPLIIENVTTSLNTTARFDVVPDGYYVVAFWAGANGSIQGQTMQLVAEGGNAAPVTAVPDDGYRFDIWSGNVVAATPQLTVNNVRSNMEIWAGFKSVVEGALTITATAGPDGAISPAGVVSVVPNSDQPFQMLPNAGYIVDEVTVDGASVGSVIRYVFADVAADHTIHATFRTNTNDRDGDGVPDAEDDYPDDKTRATPESATGTGIIVVDTSRNGGTSLADVYTLLDTDPTLNQDGKPSGYWFEDGLVHWRVENVTPGGTIFLDITFPSPVPADSVFFMVDDEGFFELLDIQITGNTVTLTLTDGGSGDIDDLINGVIRGMGGIADDGLGPGPGPGGLETQDDDSGECFIRSLWF